MCQTLGFPPLIRTVFRDPNPNHHHLGHARMRLATALEFTSTLTQGELRTVLSADVHEFTGILVGSMYRTCYHTVLYGTVIQIRKYKMTKIIFCNRLIDKLLVVLRVG